MSVTAGSDANGAHLTFVASEDFRQTAKVVPSLSPIAADKVALRRTARERRRDFVEQLGEQGKIQAERELATVLGPLLERSRITGAYCPLPAEISPIPAMVSAKHRGITIAYPAFADHDSNLRFLAGEPVETGPWAILQPALTSPPVFPDLVLMPLVAVDRRGTRLGQGKGHYDRVAADLRRQGGLLVGIGWTVQMLNEVIPADPWDIPLDGFASPDGLEMFR